MAADREKERRERERIRTGIERMIAARKAAQKIAAELEKLH